MAVDRGLWWSVWWPWATVWIVTAVAALLAVAAFMLAWRSRDRFEASREVPGLTFYLNEKSVMDLYQSGGYGDALLREVEERIGTRKGRWFGLKARAVDAGGKNETEREVVSKYIANAEPIAVIGVVLGALESDHGVVHVDLRDRTMLRNTALERALASSDRGGSDRRTARLRGMDSYVSVKGVFRMVGQTGTSTVFKAPYGDPADPEQGPQVRLECHQRDLRDDVIPEGTFQARCLGKVQSWKAADAELVIRPIAIFQ